MEEKKANWLVEHKLQFLIASGCVLALAVLIGVVFNVVAVKNLTAIADNSTTTLEHVTTEHVHDWTVVYKDVHHDAVTHTETVAPVYGNQTTYHTVCNECDLVIDGFADQHIKDTGHSGYSTNVPQTDEVLVSQGYSYEVTDEPAWDETVAESIKCATCGEVKAIEE